MNTGQTMCSAVELCPMNYIGDKCADTLKTQLNVTSKVFICVVHYHSYIVVT